MMAIPVAVGLSRVYPWTGGDRLMGSWLNFLPWYLALSAITAFALHRLVEQPGTDWRDRYLDQRRGGSLRLYRRSKRERDELFRPQIRPSRSCGRLRLIASL